MTISYINTTVEELTNMINMNHYSVEDDILVDSSGLPNSTHFLLTTVNTHNGVVSEEVCSFMSYSNGQDFHVTF